MSLQQQHGNLQVINLGQHQPVGNAEKIRILSEVVSPTEKDFDHYCVSGSPVRMTVGTKLILCFGPGRITGSSKKNKESKRTYLRDILKEAFTI